MAIDYAAIAADTLQALTEAGAAATLTTPGAATYDPTTATASATPASYTVSAVILPPGAMKGGGMTFAGDVLVRAEAMAYIGAAGLAARITPGCVLTIGTDRWAVIGADTLSPAGVAVLHGAALVRA